MLSTVSIRGFSIDEKPKLLPTLLLSSFPSYPEWPRPLWRGRNRGNSSLIPKNDHCIQAFKNIKNDITNNSGEDRTTFLMTESPMSELRSMCTFEKLALNQNTKLFATHVMMRPASPSM